MNLKKMLTDLGFPNPDNILTCLGEERVVSLTREMLSTIEPPINVLVWKAYYGIDCEAITTEKFGERLLPPLRPARVSEIRRATRRMLMYRERIQILAEVVKEIPPPP